MAFLVHAKVLQEVAATLKLHLWPLCYSVASFHVLWQLLRQGETCDVLATLWWSLGNNRIDNRTCFDLVMRFGSAWMCVDVFNECVSRFSWLCWLLSLEWLVYVFWTHVMLGFVLRYDWTIHTLVKIMSQKLQPKPIAALLTSLICNN